MKKISVGKLRGLQKISSNKSVFSVLALDHRQNLRKSFNPNNPETVPDEKLIQLKQDIISNLNKNTTAILLDPEVGSAQAITSNCLDRTNGLIIALEETGYSGSPFERHSRILEGWGAKKAKISGADAAKLLVYYNPDSKTAGSIERLVHDTVEQCKTLQIPLMLEVLTYSIDPQNPILSGMNRQSIITHSVERLSQYDIDMIKIEFPADSSADKHTWVSACGKISKVCNIPWLLLSAAVGFETYKQQVEIACREGSSGVAAGRAIWKEAINLEEKSRMEFLCTIARERMMQISDLCERFAEPWSKFFMSETINADWYKKIDD